MNTDVLIWMNEGTSNVKYGYENRIKRSQITTYLCKHLHLHRRKNRWICLTPLFSIVYTPTASMFPEWFLAPTFSPPPLMDRPQSYISSASSNRTLKKVVEYQVLYYGQQRLGVTHYSLPTKEGGQTTKRYDGKDPEDNLASLFHSLVPILGTPKTACQPSLCIGFHCWRIF